MSIYHTKARCLMNNVPLGAFRSAATDVLLAYCDMLPLPLIVEQRCYRATVRLCSLPALHPLCPLVLRAARVPVERHPSNLHRMIQLFQLDPRTTEKISSCQLPITWKPTIRTEIANSKANAVEQEETWAKKRRDSSLF
jgi:hypothetical protein